MKIRRMEKSNVFNISLLFIQLDFRAKLHGWPNTYVFTKAMGEVLLTRHSKENLPFVIVRPPIVSSTYSEPFPGWVQGYRYENSLNLKTPLVWELGNIVNPYS